MVTYTTKKGKVHDASSAAIDLPHEEMVRSAVADDVFHALSNSIRRKVLEQLSVGPASVGELAAPFDMKLSSFVQHLSVHKQSRLVLSKKRGRVRTFEIALERFKGVEDWLTERRQSWEAQLDRPITAIVSIETV